MFIYQGQKSFYLWNKINPEIDNIKLKTSMIKIGITGTLASGNQASKFLSNKRGPLFSADKAVSELYVNRSFKKLLSKKFGVKNNNQIKKSIKSLIYNNSSNLKKLEK